jgi:hypothetical protein
VIDIETFIDALQEDPDAEFVIERDGKPAAVLISIERSGSLEAMLDQATRTDPEEA